mmetsp:Transcript_20385/g.78321  ORF Transcript_20385/g.78321 Transcript_20385/m.78321 type:complete len:217 (-) Transcript_20385:682-1332(-)
MSHSTPGPPMYRTSVDTWLMFGRLSMSVSSSLARALYGTVTLNFPSKHFEKQPPAGLEMVLSNTTDTVPFTSFPSRSVHVVTLTSLPEAMFKSVTCSCGTFPPMSSPTKVIRHSNPSYGIPPESVPVTSTRETVTWSITDGLMSCIFSRMLSPTLPVAAASMAMSVVLATALDAQTLQAPPASVVSNMRANVPMIGKSPVAGFRSCTRTTWTSSMS